MEDEGDEDDAFADERKLEPLPPPPRAPVLLELVRLGLVSGAILVPAESLKSV